RFISSSVHRCFSKKMDPTPEEQPQLILPFDGVEPFIEAPKIARHRRVFCNRNIHLSQLAWVGFDMDYTLAIYNQSGMDALSIRSTIAKLRDKRGYPAFITSVPYATEFPVRGLVIDKRYGNILKMDRYKHVSKAYHGFSRLSRDEIRDLYHSKKILPAT